MRVVDLIHGGWLYAPNGASSVMRSFKENIELFNKQNIQVNFYTLDKPGDKFSTKDIRPQHRLKQYLKTVFSCLSAKFALFAFLEIWLIYMRHAKTVMNNYKTISSKGDIVFIHDIFTAYYYVKMCGGSFQQKMILVLHNNGDVWNMIKISYPQLFASNFFKKYFYSIERQVLAYADRIGFVSNNCRQQFLQEHPYVDSKVTFFVYNGIDDIGDMRNEYPKHIETEPKYRLCCVGTLSERKGQLRLIKAYVGLPESYQKDVHITLIGDGSIRAQIEQLVNTHNAHNNVHIAGTRKDVDFFLQTSNIYILPSNDEGLPISIIEAMRSGLGIISSPIAGIPELVEDGVNGLLINPDIASIQLALMSLNSYDWSVMGNNSRRKYEHNFNISSMIDSYCKIVNSL